ncbi:MAG: hypothetical protein ACE5FH_06560 [Candidatus Zixiibacteriota bacterium]
MKRMFLSVITTVALISFLAPSGQAGLQRVARRLNVVSLTGGYSTILGSYEGIGSDSWREVFSTPGPDVDVDGDGLYEPTYHLGFSYGQIRNNRMYVGVGLAYTQVRTENTIDVPGYGRVMQLENDFDFNLYDINFDFNYHLTNVHRAAFSPYVGVGLVGGFFVSSSPGRDPQTGLKFASESQLKFTTRLNFGVDLKLVRSASKRSYVALSSVNSWDVLATGQRPKYLNIGVAIKYYFRP